jgi:hypothetical protein
MKKKLLARAVLGACLSQLAVGIAAADDWVPQLLPPTKATRDPTEAIRIHLPALPASVLEHLLLELDDIDVTTLVTREGTDAVFTPPTPLPYGPHQLRLVEYAADGSIIERGVWTIEIRKSRAFREGELQINSTLTVSQRVADNHLPDTAPGKTQGSGAAHIQGVAADDNWRVQGYMDLLYNNQLALMPRQKTRVDDGQFLVKADAGIATAAVGHQTVGPDTLVMRGFNRRGVSVGLGHDTDMATVQAFSLHTQDIIGFQDGLGVGDSHNRVDGVVAVGRPIPQNPQALLLEATYLKGEGPTQTGAVGTGTVGDSFSSGGKAEGLVADSSLFEQRVRLRGEYAQSHYDFDGLNTGSGAENDHAYTALATYTPWINTTAMGMPFTWQFGAEQTRIGTFFRSPANPVDPSDHKVLRGFTQLGWGGLNLQGSYGKDQTNVDNLDLLDRTETTQSVASMMYAPTINFAPSADPTQPPAFPWYGQPNFSLTYVKLDTDVTKEGGGLAVGALHATRTLSTMAGFNYSNWMWSITHTLGRDDDFTGMADDTHSRATNLNAMFRIGARLTVGPGWQQAHVEDRTNGELSSDTNTGMLNVGYQFTDRVNGNVGYSYNRQHVQNDSMNTRTQDVTAALGWMVYPAMGTQPGLTLSLEGQYHDNDDTVTTINTINTYQVFLKGVLSWAPSL